MSEQKQNDSTVEEKEDSTSNIDDQNKQKSKKRKIEANKIFVCVCGNQYSTKQKMMEHVTTFHGGDRYCCNICSKNKRGRSTWFTTKSSLLRHCEAKHKMKPINPQLLTSAFFLSE